MGHKDKLAGHWSATIEFTLSSSKEMSDVGPSEVDARPLESYTSCVLSFRAPTNSQHGSTMARNDCYSPAAICSGSAPRRRSVGLVGDRASGAVRWASRSVEHLVRLPFRLIHKVNSPCWFPIRATTKKGTKNETMTMEKLRYNYSINNARKETVLK